MSEAHWRYSNPHHQPPSSIPTAARKRSRVDYETTGYFPRQDDRPVFQGIKSLDSINESRTLPGQLGQFARPVGVGVPGHSVNNPPIVGIGGVVPWPNIDDRSTSFVGGRPNVPFPPDASNTLFVEGLPSSCTRREVAHISSLCWLQRSETCYQGIQNSWKDQVVLGFVDFVSPAHAATAMDALQGYKFDEFDRDSVNLRLQFARWASWKALNSAISQDLRIRRIYEFEAI